MSEGKDSFRNNDERCVIIENYRTLGISEPAKLVLNRSTGDGRVGDLVILIGPNNSGKSNILCAMANVNKPADPKDYPEFLLDRDRITTKKIVSKSPPKMNRDDTSQAGEVGEEQNLNKLVDEMNLRGLSESEKTCILNLVNSRKYISGPVNIDPSYFNGNYSRPRRDVVDMIETGPSPEVMTVLARLLFNRINSVNINLGLQQLKSAIDTDLVDNISPLVPYLADEMSMTRLSHPKIVEYSPKLNVSNTELVSNIGSLNPFFRRLLRYMGLREDYLSNIIDNYKLMGMNKKVLRSAEQNITNELERINTLFNSLYFSNDAPYRFEIWLDEDSISLSITKGNAILNLKNQSIGFMWFFDFFFRVILDDGLNPGDIVLMDEPATNIHVRGQMEFRRILKEYAIKSQVTFVISTHSPFLIDCDYLDEVRIITRRDDGETIIQNNFQTFSDEDDNPDKLDPILNALTVGRNVMKGPDKVDVFVEGITDYNYLTAFAKMLGVDNISFMPIGGVIHDELATKLRSISRDPILLVDADRAGFIAKNNYGRKNGKSSKKIDVITLADIDGSFAGDYTEKDFRSTPEGAKGFTIEDLFSEDDRANILKGRKESDFSSILKTYITDYEGQFSAETIGNFRTVFDYFQQELLEDE